MTRKLDKEHLDEIQTLREDFLKNSSSLGNIAIEIHVIKRQLEQLEAEQNNQIQNFDALRIRESELLQKMRTRYGDGQINISEGTFTPSDGLTQ
jgi:hypothetical protein